MKKITIIFFLFTLFFLRHVLADFSGTAWEFKSAILGSGMNVSDFVVLDLPTELFSHVNPDLSDLRVVNADGEVPYVAAIERESTNTASVPARMYNLSSRAGETTEFILDLGSGGTLHSSVTIETPSENFRRIVEVQGSDDEAIWRTLNLRGQIFDYTVKDIKPVAVRDTTVSYPEAAYRYLLVRIFDQGEKPLTVRGAAVWRSVSVTARELSYAPTLEISENQEDRATEVILDLGVSGVPHRRGRIGTQNSNFSRFVSVYDSNDKKEWRLLRNNYFFVIQTPKFAGSQLDFSYPESNKRYLKLAIANGDDRPIAISGATLFGTVRRILFLYEPGREYHLYFGNKDARRPQYDIEKISQYVDVTTLARVSAGPIEKNSDYVPPEEKKLPLAERSPYILPTVLGIIIAMLAFLLVRLFTKNNDNPLSLP